MNDGKFVDGWIVFRPRGSIYASRGVFSIKCNTYISGRPYFGVHFKYEQDCDRVWSVLTINKQTRTSNNIQIENNKEDICNLFAAMRAGTLPIKPEDEARILDYFGLREEV